MLLMKYYSSLNYFVCHSQMPEIKPNEPDASTFLTL